MANGVCYVPQWWNPMMEIVPQILMCGRQLFLKIKIYGKTLWMELDINISTIEWLNSLTSHSELIVNYAYDEAIFRT